MSGPMDRHSTNLADALDKGRTREVVNALQQDAYKMNPEDFKRVVMQTAAKEEKCFGDNLTISRNGDIMLNLGDSGQNLRIGNLRQQEISWQQSHQRNDYRDDIGRRPVVQEGRHGRYYEDREPPRYVEQQRYDDRRYDDRRYDDRRYEPNYDTRNRYDDRYDDRYSRGGRGINFDGGQFIEDFVRGGISSKVGGGKFLPGGLTNGGIGVLFDNIGGRRNGW